MIIKNLLMLLFLQTCLLNILLSCTKHNDYSNIPNNPPMQDTIIADSSSPKTNLGWLALGDSYTIGQSVGEAERFPAQTIDLLKAENLLFDAPEYIAITGWTTQNLLDGIAQQNPQGPYDVVSLLIGVNDQYQHFDTSGYRSRFTECLNKAIALAGNNKNHVFVLSIPDYSVTPFAQGMNTAQISKEIDEFNAINKAITEANNIIYIDITPSTRQAKTDASLIAADGLHPSGKEYAQWAALLAPQVKIVLK